MSRIKLTDAMGDIAVKMTEGNPGALRVLMEIIEQGKAIDPHDGFAPMGPILSLDTRGIYGPRIWVLYTNVCHGSLVLTIAVLRSVQLGFVPEAALNAAIDSYGEGFDAVAAYRQVKERLQNFANYEELQPVGPKVSAEPGART